MKKWKLGLIVGSGVIVTSLGSAVLFNGFAHGEWDLPGLNQQVQHVTEVTDNHEGRITNLENKTDTLAGQPTPTPQVVTKVVTQSAPAVLPANTVAPAPPIEPKLLATRHALCADLAADSLGNITIKSIIYDYDDGHSYVADENGVRTGKSCVIKGTW